MLSRSEFSERFEIKGRDHPQHLAGRACGLMVHGDVGGIEGSRRSLSAWLDGMGLIDSGQPALLDRFIGYCEPYATSRECLDRDLPVQQEARDIARAVALAVKEPRKGSLAAVQPQVQRPRPK